MKAFIESNAQSSENCLQWSQVNIWKSFSGCRNPSTHYRNILILAIEQYKAQNNLSSKIMFKLFYRRNVSNNIRSQTDFSFRSNNSTNYGFKSLRCVVPKISNISLQDIRSANSLFQFVNIVKSWIPDSRP